MKITKEYFLEKMLPLLVNMCAFFIIASNWGVKGTWFLFFIQYPFFILYSAFHVKKVTLKYFFIGVLMVMLMVQLYLNFYYNTHDLPNTAFDAQHKTIWIFILIFNLLLCLLPFALFIMLPMFEYVQSIKNNNYDQTVFKTSQLTVESKYMKNKMLVFQLALGLYGSIFLIYMLFDRESILPINLLFNFFVLAISYWFMTFSLKRYIMAFFGLLIVSNLVLMIFPGNSLHKVLVLMAVFNVFLIVVGFFMLFVFVSFRKKVK